jgi:hypothetical protein
MNDLNPGQGLIQTASVSYALAQVGITAAMSKSHEMSCLICISILDVGGHEIAFGRMDGAPFQSIAIAHSKALSVAGNGIANHDFWALIKSEEQITTASSQLVGANWLGGGLPIVLQGQFVGALSVSGKSNMSQDIIIAEAAIAAIQKEYFTK